jgi:hypothetical protein
MIIGVITINNVYMCERATAFHGPANSSNLISRSAESRQDAFSFFGTFINNFSVLAGWY